MTDFLTVDAFSYYLEGVILTPIGILGIIGNVLSIYILCSKEIRNEFYTLLTALSSFDSLYLLMAILIFGLPKLSVSYREMVLTRIMPIGYGILHIARVGSVITTLSVAMDRFYVIKHPLIVHERATFLVSSCVVFSVLYNIPRFFEFQTIYLEVMDNSSVVLSPNGKEETLAFSPTDLRLHPMYVHFYVVWMKFVLIEVVPYFAILFFNIVIFLEVQKSANQRRESYLTTNEDPTQNEVRKASVLIWISVFFVVCQSVKIIPDFYEVFYCNHEKERGCKSTTTMEIIISISNFLVVTNSSINFVIYIWRGSEFRKVFKQRFQSKNSCKKRNGIQLCKIGLNRFKRNKPKETTSMSIRTTEEVLALEENEHVPSIMKLSEETVL